MLNELDYVDLGLFCADICRALDRGMGGKSLDDLSRSVCDAITQLTVWVEPATYFSNTSTYHALDRRTVAEIRGKIIKQSGRNSVSRFFHARNDKETIAVWRSDLNRILIVFNVRSVRPHLVVVN